MKAALLDLAADVDAGMPWKGVWPALHHCCYPVDDGYADRLGVLFSALRDEVDCKYQGYLSAVLRAWHKAGDFGGVLRNVAERLGEEIAA